MQIFGYKKGCGGEQEVVVVFQGIEDIIIFVWKTEGDKMSLKYEALSTLLCLRNQLGNSY